MARRLPQHAKLLGLDINLSQSLPREWLPSNVAFPKYSAFGDVLEDLLESFGVVKVTYIILVAEDNDPILVPEKFFKATKCVLQLYHKAMSR
jgi:hypothetical protein